MKYKFYPVTLNGDQIGVAEIQNNQLIIKIQHALIRGMTFGYDIDSLSVVYSEQEPHDSVITIHSVKESNGN